MNWFSEHIVEIFSVLFGVGSIGFAVIDRVLNRKKYEQQVRQDTATADIHVDEFWKNRYDVLESEMKNKDEWWKERYDNLYKEFQDERKLSNDIINNFRTELNQIREDCERQKEIDKLKYDELMSQYSNYQQEVERKNLEQIERINQLERLVADYENKLKNKGYEE